MNKLAVVILNYNGANMLQSYLPSVIANSKNADIIVIDNASQDESLDILRTSFCDVQTIVLDKNYGFASGYNKGLKDLDYQYCMLLNSDIEIKDNDWLDHLVDYMDEHNECAACAPKLLSLRAPHLFEYAGAAGGYIDRYGYPYCKGRIFKTIEQDRGQYDDICDDLLWATGAALLVRMSDFRLAGGFDDSFFAHMEEIDLCWRLRLMGKKIACIGSAKAYHLGGATLNAASPYKTFLNFRNNLLMIYKNAADDELNKILRIRALLDMIAAIELLMTSGYKHFKAVLDARKAFKQMKKDMPRTKQEHNVSLSSFSILWQYYVKGKHKFNQLSI